MSVSPPRDLIARRRAFQSIAAEIIRAAQEEPRKSSGDRRTGREEWIQVSGPPERRGWFRSLHDDSAGQWSTFTRGTQQ